VTLPSAVTTKLAHFMRYNNSLKCIFSRSWNSNFLRSSHKMYFISDGDAKNVTFCFASGIHEGKYRTFCPQFLTSLFVFGISWEPVCHQWDYSKYLGTYWHIHWNRPRPFHNILPHLSCRFASTQYYQWGKTNLFHDSEKLIVAQLIKECSAV
jgi:hypothetical protein